MLIAKIENGAVVDVADHTVLLPDTSFGSGGPTLAQVRELGFYPVSVWVPHDRATEKLEPATPTIVDGYVVNVVAVPKTEEDLANDIASRNAEMTQAREAAYRNESDALFFKAQRGEATMDAWLAKVAEIKARYPTSAAAGNIV